MCSNKVNRLDGSHKSALENLKKLREMLRTHKNKFEVTPEKDIELEETLNLDKTNSKKEEAETAALLHEVARLKAQFKKSMEESARVIGGFCR